LPKGVAHAQHLTHRDAPPEVIERARTVAELREIKRAVRRKIEPQRALITDFW